MSLTPLTAVSGHLANAKALKVIAAQKRSARADEDVGAGKVAPAKGSGARTPAESARGGWVF
jgi:hypothetical protein